MRYVGIDPGGNFAVAVLEPDGAIAHLQQVDERAACKELRKTWQRKADHIIRLGAILRGILQPGDVVVLLSNPIQRSACIAYGQHLAVVEAACFRAGAELVEIRDSSMKAKMAGHGRATKEQVIAVAKALPLSRKTPSGDPVAMTEHEADAIVAAEMVRRGLN